MLHSNRPGIHARSERPVRSYSDPARWSVMLRAALDQLRFASLRERDLDHVEVAGGDRAGELLARFLEHCADVVAG